MNSELRNSWLMNNLNVCYPLIISQLRIRDDIFEVRQTSTSESKCYLNNKLKKFIIVRTHEIGLLLEIVLMTDERQEYCDFLRNKRNR